MMTVLACIAYRHDLRLVLVAVLVCAAGSAATIRLFQRTVAAAGVEKAAWIVLAAMVAGAAIWCTHFIAMLGYMPGAPIGFDPVLTVVSLLIAAVGAALGFAVAADGPTRSAPALGGAVVGLAIALMHYTGMMGYRVRGLISWDKPYLIGSIVLSVAFSALALHFARRRTRLSASLLALAIVSLHFTGMTALHIQTLDVGGEFSDPAALKALALAVAGVALLVVGAGLASSLIDTRARAHASDALNNMSNGLVMVASDGVIRLYNDRVLGMFHLRPDELSVGMPLDQYLRNIAGHAGWSDERTQRVIDNHARWMAQDAVVRVEHHFDDGTTLAVAVRPTPGGGAVLTYDDVTELREGEKQIAHMAFHDALTGLPNRRSFVDHLGRLWKDADYALLMLDLDRFKAVNDTLGHAVGDRLLVEVARRLRDVSKPSDVVFRLGGDEFAVLTRSDREAAEALAAHLVAASASAFEIGDHTIWIGCSAGLAMSRGGRDCELVQKMADLALYEAKEKGRGRVEVYRDGMIELAEQRRALEAELAEAARDGQLELHYQPLYGLPDRVLCGFEALLRWNHPRNGLMSPADFIPIAEHSGAITQIGAWVIEEACRQAALWPPEIYVSINVSPVQLRSSEILRQITAALDRNRLTPRRIEIEITETAMVEDSGAIAAALAGLRALGIRIAMDDFGTGYSSLAHLREFELDRIKIDRSFVSASHTDAGSVAVVRAVTAMAKDLAIETTGEGVESEEQLANLIALGCGTAQGYLLGRPLSAEKATALVSGHAERSDMTRGARASS